MPRCSLNCFTPCESDTKEERGAAKIINYFPRLILPSLETPLLRQSRMVERLQIGFELFLYKSPISLAFVKMQLERFATKILVFPTPIQATQKIYVLKKETP